jgi:hypothetical protein
VWLQRLRGEFSAMNVNQFYRRFVSEVVRESAHMAPKLQLKDLYVGQKCGRLVKPWVGGTAPLRPASLSPKPWQQGQSAAYYCVSTPGNGYECEFVPGSGSGYRLYRCI